MKIGFDSNILGYAEGVNDSVRQQQALAVIALIPAAAVLIPVQALGELFNLLTRKAGMTKQAARAALSSWHGYPAAETSSAVLQAAAGLAAGHDLQIWDAIILAAAAEAGCSLLLSEDMQHGFAWNRITVANPFTAAGAEMLASALDAHII